MNNKNVKFILGLSIVIVIVLGALMVNHEPVSASPDVCPPHPSYSEAENVGWTKIDSGNLSSYPVSGATAYCFKAGNFLTSSIPDGGFGQEGACNADNIQNCGLSHWSYFIPAQEPSPTPTQPTITPEDPKDFQDLTLAGRCLGFEEEEVVTLSSATIEWTVSNSNDDPINFSWSANNGESGNGTAPANGSTTFQTSGTGNSVTLTYSSSNGDEQTGLTVEVCEEEPKDEPKDEPIDEPKSSVDPQPDQPAGGSGPAVLPLLATLLVGGSSIGLASRIILKKKS